jgi:DnaK suppressor protein
MSHLDAAQLTQAREQLAALEKELQAEIKDELRNSDGGNTLNLADSVHDASEESVADLLRDLNNALINQHLVALKQVNTAYQRLNTGHYGECSDCGEEIQWERLLNQPAASRCVACQSLREKTYDTNSL